MFGTEAIKRTVDGGRYRVFPRWGSPRVIVSGRSSLTEVLEFYEPSKLGGRLIRWLATANDAIGERVLLRASKSDENEQRAFAQAKSIAQRVLGADPDDMMLYLAPPGPRQKLTVRVKRNGRTLAYIKIGKGVRTKDQILTESAMLEMLHGRTGISDHVPRSVAAGEEDGTVYLMTSPANGRTRRHGLEPTRLLVDFSTRCFRETMKTRSIADYTAQRRWEDRLAMAREIISQRQRAAISEARAAIKERLAAVIVGLCHGDFAPWNCLITDEDGLFVLDWEYGDIEGAALFDLFHFLRMPVQLIGRWPASRTVERILDSYADADLVREQAAALGVERNHIAPYLLIYLIEHFLRHAEVLLEDPNDRIRRIQHDHLEYLTECMECVVDRLHHGKRRPRILVAAYACEPDKGSEPGVGWHWVQEIAKDSEVWVITRKNNRDAIQRHLKGKGAKFLHFEYADLPRRVGWWKKGQRGVRTYYYLWQMALATRARRLHKRVGFDLAHHVTFVNDWLWSGLALSPIPYIWGPIGSHPPVPYRLLSGWKQRITEAVRLGIQMAARTLDPLYLITVARAKRIVVINQDLAKRWPFRWVSTARMDVEPAIGMEDLESTAPSRKYDQFTVLYAGRFHYTKCPHLVVEAFAEFSRRCPEARLLLIGRGPEEAALIGLCGKLGISSRVTFMPWSSRTRVMEEMAKSHVFLFPSAEGGGMVVLEALASGTPVVCLDYGGPGAMVTGEAGVKVSVGAKQKVVQELADGLMEIFRKNKDGNPEALLENTRRVVNSRHLWSSKRRILKRWYHA